MKKIIALAVSGGLATATLAIAPVAQAKTIKACVKKSDGSVKFINKKNKKCKKGWVKKSWSSEGPQGPAGPAFKVKDASGVTLGVFAGYYTVGLLPEVVVTTDEGAVFTYRMDGRLRDNNGVLRFLNNGCTDAVVFRASNADLDPFVKSAGGSGRAVFQVTGAPTASAWKVATPAPSTVPVAANMLFQKSDDGVCAPVNHSAGFYLPLTPATAPLVAAPGPLQIVG